MINSDKKPPVPVMKNVTKAVSSMFSPRTRADKSKKKAKETLDASLSGMVGEEAKNQEKATKKEKVKKQVKKQEKNVKSPRENKKEKTARRVNVNLTSRELTVWADEQLGMTDKLNELWCFTPGAARNDLENQSKELYDAEIFLRERHQQVVDGIGSVSAFKDKLSVRGLAGGLYERPYSEMAQLNGARAILNKFESQELPLEKVANVLEQVIGEIASQRDGQYGEDLRLVTDLIKVRNYAARAIGATYNELSIAELGKCHQDMLNVIEGVQRDSPASALIEPCMKAYTGKCDFKEAGGNDNNTVNYRQAIVELHRDLGACVPSRMKPPSTMSKDERDVWLYKGLQLMIAPLKGLANKDALKKAIVDMQDKNINALKGEHAVRSGSFRAIGLLVLSVKTLAKALPESENSEVRKAVDELNEAVTENGAMLKKYSGAESSTTEEAMAAFNGEAYKNMVDKLWTLSVEVFRAAGLTGEDLQRYVTKQQQLSTVKPEQVEADGQVLQVLMEAVK